jgi:import receptor subunit TOM22
MVKVEIVEEKDSSASPYASSSSSRHSSSESLSSVDSEPSGNESFFDRVVALKDMVPPTTRHNITTTFAQTASYVKRGSKIIGNIVWVVTTSALLVALPLSLILEDENKIMAQEREILEQQQGAQQVRFGRVFLSPLIPCSPDAFSICLSCPTRFQSPGSTQSFNSSRFLSWVRSSVYYVTLRHYGFRSFLMTAMAKSTTPQFDISTRDLQLRV